MKTKEHGNRLPDEQKRVRLAGGPFVDPDTLVLIHEIAEITNISLGQAIDRLINKTAVTMADRAIDDIREILKTGATIRAKNPAGVVLNLKHLMDGTYHQGLVIEYPKKK